MEILLDDMARTLRAVVKLPEHLADETSVSQAKLEETSARTQVEWDALFSGLDEGNTVSNRNPEANSGTSKSAFDPKNHFELETVATTEEEDSASEAPASPVLSPSPPLATSPPYQLASLSLIDSVTQQRFQDTDMLRHVNTSYRAQSRREMLDGGRTLRSGLSAEGRGGGLQARC